MSDDPFFVLGAQLLACLQTSAEANPNPPPENNFLFLPGAQATADISQYQNMCCDGTAYVRMASQYPSKNFPAPDDDASNCVPMGFGSIWELGIMRCAPTGTVQKIATAAEWLAAFRQQTIDATTLRSAVCCWVNLYGDGEGVQIGQWTPVGPEGGCLIGTLSVSIQWIGCPGC